MHSVRPDDVGRDLSDDRSTPARIRDAAIECIAEHGVAATTARKVADIAGVSPGLVIHHFGSMRGLRAACDEYVAATIHEYKSDALAGGPNMDVLAAIRAGGIGPLMGYLAQVLVEDSEAVAKLVDTLVDDAEDYLKLGVESGMVLPSDDPRGRAAVITLWSLGALVLHRHMHRILGIDLTDPDVTKNDSMASYAIPAYEIFGGGLLTEEFAATVHDAFESQETEGST
jgi:AcrR family transcriptional regulator